MIPDDAPTMSITDRDIPVGRLACIAERYPTVGHLRRASDHQIFLIPNVGRRTVRKLRELVGGVDMNEEQGRKAVAMLDTLLARPPIPEDGMYSDGECFDPWSLFPCLYGSYSGAFDTMAIDVLTDIRDGTHKRDDLASEMFREMLCTLGLCDYGTSPRVCFASEGFRSRLPKLLDRWREYDAIYWKR